MDLGKLTIFNAVKKRMQWTNQRQEVLAHNIANANTPEYRARDMKPFKFENILRRQTMQIKMDTTGAHHLSGKKKALRDFDSSVVRMPYETSPIGNSVILEEQMSKLNETNITHRFTNQIYKKHLEMLKLAVTGKK